MTPRVSHGFAHTSPLRLSRRQRLTSTQGPTRLFRRSTGRSIHVRTALRPTPSPRPQDVQGSHQGVCSCFAAPIQAFRRSKSFTSTGDEYPEKDGGVEEARIKYKPTIQCSEYDTNSLAKEGDSFYNPDEASGKDHNSAAFACSSRIVQKQIQSCSYIHSNPPPSV